jgi:hypothetical protein
MQLRGVKIVPPERTCSDCRDSHLLKEKKTKNRLKMSTTLLLDASFRFPGWSRCEFTDRHPEFVQGCLCFLGDCDSGFELDSKHGIACLEGMEPNWDEFCDSMGQRVLADWGDGNRFDLGECEEDWDGEGGDGYDDRRRTRERDVVRHNARNSTSKGAEKSPKQACAMWLM